MVIVPCGLNCQISDHAAFRYFVHCDGLFMFKFFVFASRYLWWWNNLLNSRLFNVWWLQGIPGLTLIKVQLCEDILLKQYVTCLMDLPYKSYNKGCEEEKRWLAPSVFSVTETDSYHACNIYFFIVTTRGQELTAKDCCYLNMCFLPDHRVDVPGTHLKKATFFKKKKSSDKIMLFY